MKIVKSIGYQMRKRRHELDLTQIEAAELIGVCRSLYQKYEYNQVTPGIFTLLRIAERMGLDPEEMKSGRISAVGYR